MWRLLTFLAFQVSWSFDISGHKITEMVAAVYTPMKAGGLELDLDRIPDYASLLASKNITAVLPAGTNGESLSMSVEERMQLAEAWAKAASAKGMKVYMHIGGESLVDTMKLAEHAGKTAGITGIVSQTPLYFKPSLETLHEFLKLVGQKAPSLPLWYYHFPGKTGVLAGKANRLLQAIYEAGDIPTFAGLKFTDMDLGDMQLCRAVGDGHYNVLFGEDNFFLAAAILGADAPIGSTMQYSPTSRQVFSSWRAGDLAAAQKAQHANARLCDLFLSYPDDTNPQKDIMKMIGFDLGPSRVPRRDLTEEEFSELEAVLRKDQLIDAATPRVGVQAAAGPVPILA